ncbi:MAG: hypothetical protein OHK0053_18990 [Microscillaceae bacterium]
MIFFQKISTFFTFVLLFWGGTSRVWAQNTTIALMARFEHQSEAPLAYPNYFEEALWTNSLMDKIKSWSRQQFNISELDYKRKDLVNFVPGLRQPAELRSIQKTGYDLALSVVSQLRSQWPQQPEGNPEGELLVQVELWNRNQKRVYRSRGRVSFMVAPYPDALAEVNLSQADFALLYETALRVAFAEIPRPESPLHFRQPAPEMYQDFRKKAEKFVWQAQDRTTFILLGDTSQKAHLEFTAPYQLQKKYGRGGALTRPFATQALRLEGSLLSNAPFEVEIQVFERQELVGRLKSYETPEQQELRGQLGKDHFRLMRNRTSGVVKIEWNDRLIALLEPQALSQDQLLYLAPSLLESLRADIFTLLMSEVLSEAVRKFYRYETGTEG